jgi:hypothetical protein
MNPDTTDFDKLWDTLVPRSGHCDTYAGELIRAAGRLQYDFYNNGMGNNTSGCVNFLKRESVITDEIWETVHYYSVGRFYQGGYEGDEMHNSINEIVRMTTELVMTNPQLMTIENSVDCFDLDDEEISFCSQCGAESDNYVCGYCQEDMDYECHG